MFLSKINISKESADQRAFTLAEIIVVIVIIGVLASLSLPKLGKAIERSREDTAINNLQTMHASNYLFNERTGGYWPDSAGTKSLSDINADLGLNILIPDGDPTYECTGGGANYSCTADFGTFLLTLTEADLAVGVNPCCTDGTGSCPNPVNHC